MTKTLEEWEADRFVWSLKTFKKATAIGSLKKASGEILEAIDELTALENGRGSKERLVIELADVMMCVFDCAARSGIQVGDLRDAFAKKFEINKSRIWKDNGDGSYSHVKEGANAK